MKLRVWIALLCLVSLATHSTPALALMDASESRLAVTQPPAPSPIKIAPLESSQTVVVEFEDAAWWLWNSLGDGLSALAGALTPPNPGDVAYRIDHKDSEFWSLIAEAGYKLKEVETSLGMVPGVSATFQLARELSAADREALEARLEHYAEREKGLVPRLHRSILYVILDASEAGSYRVEKLEVVLVPLPKAKFILIPVTP
ncbi:exported hypothetical protein [Candidatus Terasakiella magnetica]|nr:exported hypothetical protein [Candidatus Terasakiella magnetica]